MFFSRISLMIFKTIHRIFTKKHIEAINTYGLIDGYRKSYGPVKEVIGGNN